MRNNLLLLLISTTLFITSCKNNNSIKESEEKESENEAPLGWLQQEFEMTKDPALGYVPYERLALAKAYTNNLIAARTTNTNALAWSERGPNNVGGRTRAIFVDKRDATGNTIFAGGVGGGIWKCTNFKSTNFTWTPVANHLANLAVCAMVQDPTTPNTMYAGTGEGWYNIDAIRGIGIYKSIDGGVTWNPLAATQTGSDFDFVQDLVVTNTGIIFAATRSRFCNAGGVFRSSDGGTTWVRALGTVAGNCTDVRDMVAADLEIAANGDLFITTGLQGDAESTKGKLYKSATTNAANIGTLATWVDITPTLISGGVTNWRRIELAVAPSDANILYALCQKSATSTNAIGAIQKSIDGGTTWTNMTLPSWCDQGSTSTDFTRGQCWYDLVASVDPNNSNTLFVGGVDMLKTVDGGTIWSQISQWSSGCGASINNVHADIHNIIHYPTSSNQMISANDGGIYYSADGGTTWTAKNTNYNVTQFYSAAMHPTNTNYFLAGAQDNGTQKFQSAGVNSTTRATGGDGGFCHIDQTDGQIQITSFTNNQYTYSRNGGANFSSVSGGTGTTGYFINPTEYDDAQDVLYTSASMNTYGLVTGLSGTGTPIYQVVNLSDLSGKRVTAFKVDPNVATGGTVWMVGSNSGSPVFVKISDANTTSPVLINSFVPAGFTAGCNVVSLDVENGNSNHLLATVSNYGAVSVLESIDGANTWVSVEGNLPDMPIRWGIFAPNNALLTGSTTGGGIIVATETGVWCTSASNGTGTTWVPQNTGLASVSCYMLKYRPIDRTVAVATHGRGLYTSIIPSTTTSVNTVLNTKGFITYVSANPNTLFVKAGNITGIKNMQINIVDMQGRLVFSNKYAYNNLSIPINNLSPGGYVIKVYGDKKEQYTQQFVK